MAGINRYRLAIAGKYLGGKVRVESEPVEVRLLEVVAVRLFRELPVASHLKEADPVRYAHVQLHGVHEYFFEAFAYISGAIECFQALCIVLVKYANVHC